MKLIQKTRKIKNKWYGLYECPSCNQEIEARTDTKANNCRRCAYDKLKTGALKDNRLYVIYNNMKQRCGNKKHTSYLYYGAKGIEVSWETFNDFRLWAESSGYKEGLTIDRIDGNKSYIPENCQWITRSENTRKAHTRDMFDSHNGIKISIDDASEICEMYETGLFSQREIAEGFDVTRPTISNIIKESK